MLCIMYPVHFHLIKAKQGKCTYHFIQGELRSFSDYLTIYGNHGAPIIVHPLPVTANEVAEHVRPSRLVHMKIFDVLIKLTRKFGCSLTQQMNTLIGHKPHTYTHPPRKRPRKTSPHLHTICSIQFDHCY